MKDKSLSIGNARLNIYAMKDKKQPTRNAEYLREYRKRMTAEQKEKRREYNKRMTAEQKEKRREYNKKYSREYRKRLTDEQKEKQRARVREYLKATAYGKAWYQKNKDKMAAYAKQYNKTSEAHKLRCWLNAAVKRQGGKKTTWFKHVGCTKEEFIEHIKEQFVEGMTWDNRGKYTWHLDHIIPLAKGGTNHYTNLQPLWAIDNLSKSDKIV